LSAKIRNFKSLASRFHIEELISQDSSGVIFRAMDSESGQAVAIRRFFPFGAGGRGLEGEECMAYDIAIQRLSQAVHPALRAVIDGGCDPVDGVPFLVTEVVEGQALSQRVENGPLASREAIEIIMRALEISEVLSQLLAEQAVWVETHLTSIIDAGPESERGVTFWISPLKWLGSDENRRSLRPVAVLTEELMGWKGKLVNDQAGNNLAGWLKWLKQHADRTTLAEARETLAAATGAPPPPPTARLVRQATRPVIPRAATVQTTGPVTVHLVKRSKAPLILSLVGVVLLLAAAGLYVFKDKVPFLAKLMPGKVVEMVDPEGPAPVVDPAVAGLKPEGPFQPGDLRVITGLKDKPGSITGIVSRVRWSASGRTLFIEFEDLPPLTYAVGAIRKADAPADMTPEKLSSLVGKKVILSGIVGIDKSNDPERPMIFLKGRESIETSP
jgi:hypothetical protein